MADIIGMLDFIQEANIYGVAVPGMNIFQVWKDSQKRISHFSFAMILLIQNFIYYILK